ncbi:thioesterase [Streptomyces kaniharaensis]|uniref:Thioesterase n=1 Tax=Streptomyces kaniharaensis TaxID=212423 RepID=A0A6N7KWG3_9ACTN|nr:alpha/beta fold hydrolase [Streptomyces kaniharaensis]MQS15791.1 thioesterase [Streptomyces kaniharaensis]
MSAPDTTVVRLKSSLDPARTLVCLGFCGGGTATYHSWIPVLPDDVDLVAICYPGREGRFAEECAQTWSELAADTAQGVASVAAQGPYVLFGHSMGGWMAFDVTARLAAAGAPAPQALVVSACNAPDRGVTDRDRFLAQGQRDDELLDWMRTHGLLPDHVLDEPELTEMAVELMRADLRARDTFHYTPGTRVDVPLQVFSGDRDPVIGADVGSRWAGLTDGAFRHDVLPGGHFYTPEVWRDLPTRIASLTSPATAAL